MRHYKIGGTNSKHGGSKNWLSFPAPWGLIEARGTAGVLAAAAIVIAAILVVALVGWPGL